MSLEIVNQKVVDGQTYIAYRDSENPRLQFVGRNGEMREARLKDVWNNPSALKALF